MTGCIPFHTVVIARQRPKSCRSNLGSEIAEPVPSLRDCFGPSGLAMTGENDCIKWDAPGMTVQIDGEDKLRYHFQKCRVWMILASGKPSLLEMVPCV